MDRNWTCWEYLTLTTFKMNNIFFFSSWICNLARKHARKFEVCHSPIDSEQANNPLKIITTKRKLWNQGIYSIAKKRSYLRLCRALESQSIAWSSPSPLIADVLKIWNVLFLSKSKPKAWWTSATLIAPSISCLLARTARMAPFSSSS